MRKPLLNLTQHPDFILDDDPLHPIPNFTDAWDLEALDRILRALPNTLNREQDTVEDQAS